MEKTVNLNDVYRELRRIEQNMITKTELVRAFETVAVMSNPDTMGQIVASEKDISAGDVKEVSSVEDL